MKPAAFEYAAAASVPEAVGLLGGCRDAVALAGGQSLVPLLNFRLARPRLVVDLNRVGELGYLRRCGEGLSIGALARQAEVERSGLVARCWPLLAQAVHHAGHPATRTRGTVGGSVAHADPRAELPVALLALDARLRLRSLAGERTLPMAELWRGPFMTTIAAGELLCSIEVPAPAPGTRMAFAEFARTHGGFALAGAAVVLAPGEHAAIALLGAGPVPARAGAAERALLAGASVIEVASQAVAAIDDRYRRALLAAVLRGALDRIVRPRGGWAGARP